MKDRLNTSNELFDIFPAGIMMLRDSPQSVLQKAIEEENGSAITRRIKQKDKPLDPSQLTGILSSLSEYDILTVLKSASPRVEKACLEALKEMKQTQDDNFVNPDLKNQQNLSRGLQALKPFFS